MTRLDHTIAAIATAPGIGGIAVIRLSGAQSWEIARSLFSKPRTAFAAGRFYYGWLLDPADRTPLDEVLLLMFEAPHSFTGEDAVEIQCHGSPVITRKILDCCFHQGARAALPGEFTKRAFLNGRLDLTQAESVLDLIHAGGEAMARMAGTNLKSRSLGQYIDAVREGLIPLQAQLTACVDFPDEVEEPSREAILPALQALLQKIEALREAAQHNQLVRQGVQVALLGMPNAGKSSLFNALLARERSIVTDLAGTTRDVITEDMHLDGIRVTLIDTAGIRQGENQVEMLGVERSWMAADEAQWIFYVYDATTGMTQQDRQILAKLDPARVCRVANKIDLLAPGQPACQEAENHCGVSSYTGAGLAALTAWLSARLPQGQNESCEIALSLNHRQLGCLERVLQNLAQAFQTLADPALPIDLVTVPLTEALRAVDALMGYDTQEAVLDSVFSQFCVGK